MSFLNTIKSGLGISPTVSAGMNSELNVSTNSASNSNMGRTNNSARVNSTPSLKKTVPAGTALLSKPLMNSAPTTTMMGGRRKKGRKMSRKTRRKMSRKTRRKN